MLLAPASNLESARQAFEAGADAVYVGIKGRSRGGARCEVHREQLRECINLAHRLSRKLQLAANIVPKPRERSLLLQELSEFADWGLDTVILNDIGMLCEIRQELPALEVVASIGCGALNVDDVLVYEDLGASSVVLPGDLEPHEIAAIRARTSLQLEVMVHMVAEFIQLGKCWMPSYVNFAAGERTEPQQRLGGSVKRGGVGACFRICQQPWKLEKDGQEVDCRLFPSRQVSRIQELAEFLEAGVDVVKIQGRSLPPEIAVAIISAYRSAIDGRQYVVNGSWNTTLPQMWTVKGR